MPNVILTSELRDGTIIEFGGEPLQVLRLRFARSARGEPFYQTQLRNLLTGATIDRSYRNGESVVQATTEVQTLQFVGRRGTALDFVNRKTQARFEIDEALVEGDAPWFRENVDLTATLWQGRLVLIPPPAVVTAKVVDVDPQVHTDAGGRTSRNATLDCGAVLAVPLFIQAGDLLKVTTRGGAAYDARVER